MEHAHRHHDASQSDGRLFLAVAVNLLLTAGQIIGGVVSGSLALIADALHNLNDAAALGIALIARRIARRPADARRTFGYRRAELIGALINLTALLIVGLFLVYEALVRFFEQRPISGWIVIVVAGLALLVDLVTVALTYTMSRGSLNVRAAFVHHLADALASVGVMIAGTLILLYEWYWVDLLAALAISGYILWHGLIMIRATIRILMDSVPHGIDLHELVKAMETIEHVQNVHHVHVRQFDEHHRAMEAHILIDIEQVSLLERIKADLKHLLAERFDIHHSTLEFEFDRTLPHSREIVPPH